MRDLSAIDCCDNRFHLDFNKVISVRHVFWEMFGLFVPNRTIVLCPGTGTGALLFYSAKIVYHGTPAVTDVCPSPDTYRRTKNQNVVAEANSRCGL